MRCKFSILLAASGLAVLALNVPATGKPASRAEVKQRSVEVKPRGDARAAAQVRQARNNRHAAQRRLRPSRQVYASLRAGERLPPLPTAPVTTRQSRPMFGWPSLVTEARKYLGTNPTSKTRLWCATFLNFVLAKVGYSGTGSDAAKSFASYGKRVYSPRVGAIAVLTRGRRGGHVGIVTGIDPNGNPIIISGNHGKRVGEGAYARSRVIAYVMPTDRQPNTQLASATQAVMSQALAPRATDASSDDGIPSPIAELLAAINSESPRRERVSPAQPQMRPAPPPQRVVQARAQAPAAVRIVQQMPQQPAGARRDLPLDPKLARFLGIR